MNKFAKWITKLQSKFTGYHLSLFLYMVWQAISFSISSPADVDKYHHGGFAKRYTLNDMIKYL